jgi:hypothetical protein
MTTLLTGTTVTPGNTANGPAAGELVTAASVNNALQQLLNQDLNLSDGKFLTGARTVTRAMDGMLQDVINGTVIIPGFALLQLDGQWQQMIVVPHGATITAVTAYINPPNDGNTPGTFPKCRLWKKKITDGTQTAISSDVSDPTVTLAAYEAAHGFGPTGLSEVVDRTTTVYYAIVTGESGANKTDITFYGCTVTYSMTTRDDGI